MRDGLISRRKFLGTAGISTLSFIGGVGPRSFQSGDPYRFADLRANILQMINEERTVEKISRVALDDLATSVATAHAEDMATGAFLSHWGRNGYKPYHRYSFAGGYHATAENISAVDNTWTARFEELRLDTSYLHVRLYNEKPPNNGHRTTILAPQHTHVGIGFAVDHLRLRMVELFVSNYIELKTVPRTGKPRERVIVRGKLRNSSHWLNIIEVFYEPLPDNPSLEWLRESKLSYSLPRESAVLRPKLPGPFTYSDGERGVIAVSSSGDFEAPITLFKETPGIYTVVCWIKRKSGEKAFPATELCIRAENITP